MFFKLFSWSYCTWLKVRLAYIQPESITITPTEPKPKLRYEYSIMLVAKREETASIQAYCEPVNK